MGPLSTRSHPGQELVATQPTESKPAGRAKQEVDCGRTQREGYVFGAFQPASGKVVIATSTSRSIKHFADFLDQVEAARRQLNGSMWCSIIWGRIKPMMCCFLTWPICTLVFLPAQICRLLQLDRAMVENPQITG